MSAPRHSTFVSYRRVDSVYAVDQLDSRMKQAFGAEAVFRDASTIAPGAVFPEHIRRALGEARVALVVIGPWWLRASSDPGDLHSPRRLDDPADWVRIEIETLLRRGDGVAVIPLLLGGVNLPKAADLPPSLQALPSRNGMNLRPYPDFDDTVRQVIAAVAKLLNVTPQPFEPHAPGHPETPPHVSSTRLSVTGKKFVGREQELHLLDEAWGRSAGDKINIVSLIGQGGEGKTALVLQWYSRRARHGWQGARRVFDWSFYSQGTSAQTSASADEFFNAAFAWFGHTSEVPKDAWAKGGKLAELIAAERTLLVLDGLEPLQQPPGGYGGEFKDPAMKALLRGLALNNPGLCILTSRTDITDLANFEHADGSCLRHPLHSLDPTAARALLRQLGVLGPDKELDEAIEWFHGHAYDLNLLGNFLGKCTLDHDIRGWQQRFPLLKEDERIHPILDAAGKRTGHGRRMLRAYERWLENDSRSWWRKWLEKLFGRPRVHSPAVAILRLLGLFDRPVRSDLLDELRAAPAIPGLTDALVRLPDEEWLATLEQLQQLALISREPVSLPDVTVDSGEQFCSADGLPSQVLEKICHHEDLPAETKERRNLVVLVSIGKNWAKKAERPQRPVTFAVDCQPLLRQHFAAELREQYPSATRKGHQRLYEYFCATTPDRDQPTLEDLQPLFRAVFHGCQAALQNACFNVYQDRIERGQEAYSTKKLGVHNSGLEAVACFFESVWNRVSPALSEVAQAWMLNQAAYHLRALGRLSEALEPMRAALKNLVTHEDWRNAAASACNLSALELTLGEVAAAVGDAEQSVTYADRSGNSFQRTVSRATHADALHQAGCRVAADAQFREALQAESVPDYVLLYSIRGFRYCDLLFADAERVAWQSSVRAPSQDGHLLRSIENAQNMAFPSNADFQSGMPHAKREEQIQLCRAIEQRAARIREVTADDALLDIALIHLIHGRAALYADILGLAELPPGPNRPDAPQRVPTEEKLATARRELDAAVAGLRCAGTQHYLPLGLLTRAWFRFVAGKRTGSESAQSDLDEAWEIAARGSMKLFLADIHLYRARLFGLPIADCGLPIEETKYPWESPAADLAAAETLINACGYHRRDEELADAKAALGLA